MRNKIKAIFNWSGGKDSALALQKVLDEGTFDVVSLLTTVNSSSLRSTMHAIPVSLLQKQAESIGIPLHVVETAPEGGISDYEEVMLNVVKHYKAKDVNHFIFGDIFLHDVKSYREKQLLPHGITVVEPLWGKSSEEVMSEFLQSGLKTIIVTTMANLLGKEYIGQMIDRKLIDSLPNGIDICGENGEYHTFCFAGRMFSKPVEFSTGEPLFKRHSYKLDNGNEEEFTYWFANLA